MPQRKFFIEFGRAPGDMLMVTALVRDLKLTYGDEILVNVRGDKPALDYPDIWRNNPYLSEFGRRDGVFLKMDAKNSRGADVAAMKLSQSGAGRHYINSFHTAFTQRTRIPVSLLYSKPDLHLTEEEKANPLVSKPYWVICPGWKTDMTNKSWLVPRWKEVVERLRGHGISFIQEGASKKNHINYPIEGALDLINKTSIRDLIRNIYHSEGVICLCSLPMHIAAALDKPCVVIFGGREEPSYEWYRPDPVAFGRAEPVKVPHVLLHTIGQLPCCQTRGCWKRRVVPLPDTRTDYNKSLCQMPDKTTCPDQPVAQCMSMITTDMVVDAVLSYCNR
jgi:hypothetical protein